MLPSSGLKSPSLSQSEIEEIPSSLKASSLRAKRLLSTKKIASRETESLQRKACACLQICSVMRILKIVLTNIE